MKDLNPGDLSHDEWDEIRNPRPGPTDFDRVVDAAISRRGFLSGALVFGSGAAALGLGTMMGSTARAAVSRFPFENLPIHTDHTIHVPDDYQWKIFTAWGDKMSSDAMDFDHATGGDAASAAKVFGENTDGMETFPVGEHLLLAVNHEYPNPAINLPQNADGLPASLEDVQKLQDLQGVSVIELAQGMNGWEVKVDSPFNRRISNRTPMTLDGPAAGHDLLKTEDDPSGTKVLGTLNNCGSGKTPWGTYLTCEENFNGYFGSTDADLTLPEDYKRYGIGHESYNHYEKFDARFDLAKTLNEPRRFGYIVEIDPANPESTPVKHTALGRFKHENAECVIARDGRLVVYLGDDERGEYLYRYVSNGVYTPGGDTSDLLADGQLYAAKFNADGTGEWLALTEEATGMSKAEICIFTRQAATKLGATSMDRPEWVAANPVAIEAYCALTNNSKRKPEATNRGGVPMEADGGANPRNENGYGQIVRWYPESENHAAVDFTWDLFCMAGNPRVHEDAYAGSANVNQGNMFNSPDGMSFDTTGLLWIQTDGDDSNEGDFEGQGNNQMLVGDPVSGEIRRFLTAPQGAEVTGLCWSDDLKTMFVGIQHPDAPFPDGEGKLPRSAIVAVTRKDGGRIG